MNLTSSSRIKLKTQAQTCVRVLEVLGLSAWSWSLSPHSNPEPGAPARHHPCSPASHSSTSTSDWRPGAGPGEVGTRGLSASQPGSTPRRYFHTRVSEGVGTLPAQFGVSVVRQSKPSLPLCDCTRLNEIHLLTHKWVFNTSSRLTVCSPPTFYYALSIHDW